MTLRIGVLLLVLFAIAGATAGCETLNGPSRKAPTYGQLFEQKN